MFFQGYKIVTQPQNIYRSPWSPPIILQIPPIILTLTKPKLCVRDTDTLRLVYFLWKLINIMLISRHRYQIFHIVETIVKSHEWVNTNWKWHDHISNPPKTTVTMEPHGSPYPKFSFTVKRLVTDRHVFVSMGGIILIGIDTVELFSIFPRRFAGKFERCSCDGHLTLILHHHYRHQVLINKYVSWYLVSLTQVSVPCSC